MSVVVEPSGMHQVREALRRKWSRGTSGISVCGGRHAGGGQQFATDGTLMDTRRLSRVLSLDEDRGLLKVEAGIRWPALYTDLHERGTKWAVHQKQGGADELSLGGAVSSNIHGRCLSTMPIVQDIEELEVLDPDGSTVRCNRSENFDRFRHVVGGYGMFGIIYSVTLRLVPRQKLVKRVRWVASDDAIPLLEAAAEAGALHGDFQYAVDEQADSYMREGILSWYEPCDEAAAVYAPEPGEADEAFLASVALAHLDKPRALAAYRKAMLATDGRVNWSDSWQTGDYIVGYHRHVDVSQPGAGKGSEVLSEIYVPRDDLPAFLREAGEVIRDRRANLIYGTVRLIQRDDTTVLAWAKQDYACVIFNFHTELTPPAVECNADTFRAILDRAIARNGAYYLTYHRFARRDQVLSCYPQLPAILRAKEQMDPRGLIQSDWYRHYQVMFL